MPRQPIDKRFTTPIPALHPERDLLLDAIRDADDNDDLPALVYADWQDEHGQPEHAELIRVMCEMARSRTRDKNARRSQLLGRMKELFKTPALKPLRELESDTWRFQRGFIHELSVELYPDMPAGPVRKRRACGPPGQLDLPAFVPFDKVAWLGLDLQTETTADTLAALADQTWLRRVDRIEFQWHEHGYLGPGAFGPLIESGNLTSLRVFRANMGRIAGDELVALYTGKSTTSLCELDLPELEGRITTRSASKPTQAAFVDAVTRIVSARTAARLTSLGEGIVTPDEATARALLESKYLGGVRKFCYDAVKLSKRTKARLAERFGPPVRI